MNTAALHVLQQSLEEKSCALILSRVSRQYLSGFSSSDGTLLISSDEAFLYLDSRYYEMALIGQKEGRIPREITIRPFVFKKEFSALCREGKVKKVLFEEKETTVWLLSRLQKDYPEAVFSPMGTILEKSRIVKSGEEIARIRASQELSEAAFSYILPRLKEGRTETEIAAEIEFFMKKNGASEPSFPTICVSGSRTSLPHGTPSAKLLGKNEFITMDFGCVLDGYASDMTRTVCLGKASEEMKTVYGTVLRAQDAAIRKVKAGVVGKEVDDAARSVIAAAGYGAFFGHSTGHGIGLCVHEAPSFSPSEVNVIPRGAVLSVEPGIYLPEKFGVRIEDLVAVEENGALNLNRSSKELLELS